MQEFMVNPRRAPRAPLRCRARIVGPAGTLEAETEDLGPRGAQVISSQQVRKGDTVRLVVVHPAMREPLDVQARVKWASDREPWRAGVGFEEVALKPARRWFEKLLEASPGVTLVDRVPERIPIEASLFLGPPPRFVLDFTPDEGSVLRAIGSGATLDELRARLRERWVPVQRAIFSLLARNHVTLNRGEGVHPEAWKRILAELESSQALASLAGAPTPAPVAVTPRPAPGPRTAAPRNPDAQACLDRAMAEIGRGQVHTGIALLRRAAQLAPGDPEITAALTRASAQAAPPRR